MINQPIYKYFVGLTSILMVSVSCLGHAQQAWQQRLDQVLPELGHRNWIVIADSAYPKQSAAGIETIYTGDAQIEVLKHVLAKIHAAPHVQANILIDKELSYIDNEDALGIADYRAQLKEIFKDHPVDVMLHDEIINKLDSDAKVFNILLLKTNMVLPYTTVFVRLEAGYWDAEKEQRLRDKLPK